MKMEFKDNGNKKNGKTEKSQIITTCPDCGKPITIENDAGNGFCKDCAPNH